MALRNLAKVCGLFRNKATLFRSHNGVTFKKIFTKVFLSVPFIGFTAVSAANVQLSDPDPEKLTHSYLIRNAALSSLTSANAVLVQTFSALMDSIDTYNELVRELHDLYELSLQVMGARSIEEQVWDSILKQRALLHKQREEKQELQTMFASAEALVRSAAEAAFISGAEYASITASELIHTSQLQYKQKMQEMEREEERLIAVEVKSIEVVTKREEDQPIKEIKTLDDLEIVEENIVPEVNEEDTKDLSEEQTEEEKESAKDSRPNDDDDDELKNWFDFGKERFKEEEEKEIKDSYGYFRDESAESKKE